MLLKNEKSREKKPRIDKISKMLEWNNFTTANSSTKQTSHRYGPGHMHQAGILRGWLRLPPEPVSPWMNGLQTCLSARALLVSIKTPGGRIWANCEESCLPAARHLCVLAHGGELSK